MGLVNVVVPPLAQAYTYSALDSSGRPQVGLPVRVPLGRRNAEGFIVQQVGDGESTLERSSIKPILEILDSQPSFSAEQLRFFEWVARYYGESLSSVIDAAIPKRVKARSRRMVELLSTDTAQFSGRVQQLIYSTLAASFGPKPVDELTAEIRNAGPALARMVKKELIRAFDVDDSRSVPPSPVPEWAKREVELNDDQKAALSAILDASRTGGYAPFLLHGVTGSGKTEVYIEAIRALMSEGRGALVIVPEIALTPQLVDRFRGRLGNTISVLHSGLHARLRWEGWRALLDGRTYLAIGARSAVFAPVPSLGLIIVDEEHDGSYKQQEGIRYNARDLALARGRLEGCPVVLGSATPSLETFHNAQQDRYRYLSLPARHATGSGLQVIIVDLGAKKPWDMASKNVSLELHGALDETLKAGDQSFILYNRRGFSSYLQCNKCEHVVNCPHCSVTLTFHKHSGRAQCHYCNYSTTPPNACEECAKRDAEGEIVYRGAGTEKIFDELKDLFPEYRIERLDRDIASNEEEYRAILKRVRDGDTQVLVGTQMIAKGHDLPGVTLVGIVDCDVGIHMPDFRAGERVFQLLTQAGGRAGRGDKRGRVLLQTRVPRHPSIVCTVHQDYHGFAGGELQYRRELGYPPFLRLLRVIGVAEESERARDVLAYLRDVAGRFIADHALDAKILGPAPAPIARIKSHFRWHMLLRSPSPAVLHRVMLRLKHEKAGKTKVRVVFDLDPQDMM